MRGNNGWAVGYAGFWRMCRRWWRLACPLCDQPADQVICSDCWAGCVLQPPQVCPRCALPIGNSSQQQTEWCIRCQFDPPPYQGIYTPWAYAPPLSRLIYDLKFHNRPDYARVWAWLWQQGWSQIPAADPRPWCQHDPPWDLMVPIPLHPSREWERGYNQSALWAYFLAKQWKIPCDRRALIRVRQTQAQSQLDQSERAANIRGAFAITPGAHRTQRLMGKRIALVDDVVTTGHTVREAAQILRAAGVSHIDVLVMARTWQDK